MEKYIIVEFGSRGAHGNNDDLKNVFKFGRSGDKTFVQNDCLPKKCKWSLVTPYRRQLSPSGTVAHFTEEICVL